MSNSKISALTSATTPLAGTEVLPIVQSSATVKVATNDLTVRNVRANASAATAIFTDFSYSYINAINFSGDEQMIISLTYTV